MTNNEFYTVQTIGFIVSSLIVFAMFRMMRKESFEGQYLMVLGMGLFSLFALGSLGGIVSVATGFGWVVR